MRGTIVERRTKNGDKRFDAVYRDTAGRQRWRTFHARRDAERFLTRQVAERDADTSGLPIALPGDAWLDKFETDLDDRLARGALKPSTVTSYKSVIKNHVRPFFKPFRSDRITHRDVAAWTGELADKLRDEEIAAKTHNNVINLWSALIAWSRHPGRRYVVADLSAVVERARAARVERRFLEPDQVRTLLAKAPSTVARRALTLAVYAGLRRGEIVAMQAGDFDHVNAQLRVQRAVSGGKVLTPKTATSFRTVDLPAAVLQAFVDTLSLEPTAWLFPNAEGNGPIHPDTLDELVGPAFTAAEVPVRLHGLRHTCASILIAHGEPAKYLSEQLGHASIQITLDLYGHLFKETRRTAMARLDALIATPAPKPEPPARAALRVIAGGKR